MLYKVEITETLQTVVEVDAESEEDACDIVEKMYNDEEIVLYAESFVGKSIDVIQ